MNDENATYTLLYRNEDIAIFVRDRSGEEE